MIEFIAGYVAGVLTLVLAMLVGEQLRRRAAIEMGEPNFSAGDTIVFQDGDKAEVKDVRISQRPRPTDSILTHHGVDGALHRGHGLTCPLCARITRARKT